ncbi:DUF1330 domain-containing protein [Paraliomyxa miuraensis]|uniref:DUF1330 domain-containing protein n=1 Tax=Paraliomyxa miuraensis TaxID=376150 RepID=UPI002255209E|nr:DUF1330 domain-containing protein [Paraliomyxa miuraensis]MCX4240910.1 DUF1330 domain-containing protein [Paraliomyxa miuraensis]
MTALLVVNLKVKDSEKLKEYGAQTPAIFKKFGGELVHKGKQEMLFGSGNARFDTTVVYRFASRDAVKAWYDSVEYQALLPLRDEAMDSEFAIVG